jgi:hypothetical protein
MMHEIEKPDAADLRKFGLVTGTILALLFGVLLPWLFGFALPTWPWVIAGLLVSLALIYPLALGPVYLTWMRIGLVLGWINTRIILGLVFYLIFMPVGFFLKLLGKDPMRRQLQAEQTSYRITSQAQPKDHMEKPF